jgi:hypothetical protein
MHSRVQILLPREAAEQLLCLVLAAVVLDLRMHGEGVLVPLKAEMPY